jgi:pimeloyl-ACP methyl ester carboxylesterase
MLTSTSLDLLHDFGGDGPVIHLAHANGFPPATYRLLADSLINPSSTADPHYHVVGLPARPLWPDEVRWAPARKPWADRWPGSRPESAPTWRPLADDLIQTLDDRGLHGIYGVGHSLGGVLTMWAAIRRPDLFRAVVLIDPVILPPAVLWAMRLMRALGLRGRQPLVQGALRRRRTWPSRQACYEHLRDKPLFARWPDVALWDYVEAGTKIGAGGQAELVYPPEWEAHIFATTPADVWRDVPRLRTPTLVIRGEHSDTFRPEAQARMARLMPDARFLVISDAGHLVPMERPAETGEAIRSFLDSLGG